MIGTESDGPSRLRGRLRLVPVVLIAAALAVYCTSFDGAFVFDDGFHIVENERIRHLWPPGDVLQSRRPVVNLSLAINYALGELNVRGYHAFNLGVHVLAGLTLFGLVRRTLACPVLRGRFGRASTWLALSTALIWIVHPLQTQSVTYVIQRGESMMGLFYLLMLYSLIRSVESSRPWRWYVVSIAACALGMGSKAVMVTAPVMVLLYDRVFIACTFRQALRCRWRLYIGLATTWGILWACGVLQGVLSTSPELRANVGFAYKGISPVDYLLTQPGVLVHYLKLSFWPAGLCLDYAWPVAKGAREIVSGLMVIAPLFVATMWALFAKRPVGFVGAWFFVILAPTSSFVPIHDPALEHRMYLPLAALIAFVVLGAHRGMCQLLDRRSPRNQTVGILAGALALLVAVPLTAATIRRNADYRSEVAMWRDVARKRPRNPRAMFNLGNACADRGAIAEAVDAYRAAVRLDPGHLKARYNLAQVLQETGRTDQAVAHYQELLRIDPRIAEPRANLGAALLSQGRYDEAIAEFRTVLAFIPSGGDSRIRAFAHLHIGKALAASGRIDDAIREYRAALAIQPDHQEARHLLETTLTN